MSIDERVLHCLAEITGADEVRSDLDVRLYDEHLLDSLGTVELILALSDQFGIEISPADVAREDWATPRLLIADVTRRMEAWHVA